MEVSTLKETFILQIKTNKKTTTKYKIVRSSVCAGKLINGISLSKISLSACFLRNQDIGKNSKRICCQRDFF